MMIAARERCACRGLITDVVALREPPLSLVMAARAEVWVGMISFREGL